MIQFFQTKMGDKFFNVTFPKLVAAIEALVEKQTANKELENRVAVLELLIRMPYEPGRLECVDGFSIIIGSSIEDEYGLTYHLSFPSGKEKLLEPYRDNPDSPEAISYSYVPHYILVKTLIKRGGLVNA